MNKGIFRISDLLHGRCSDHFLSFKNVKNKIRIRFTFSITADIIAAIPKDRENVFSRRDQISANEPPETPQLTTGIQNVSAYCSLRSPFAFHLLK